MRKKFWRLILASQSPRRKEILSNANFVHTTFTSNSSESFDENLTLDENLCAIAETKVEAAVLKLNSQKLKGTLILGADTVVVLGRRVLGKPKNKTDARRMLGLLSGKTHIVKTAFSIFCPDQRRGVTRIIATKVGFRKLTSLEIKTYVDSGEPFDKAGSYALQGLGGRFINFLNGDLLNVVGLPIFEVENEFRKQRWQVATQRKPAKNFRKNL